MEPTEIQEFSNQLKEAAEPLSSRHGSYQKSREEPLTTISLAISILAVLVAMVTVLGRHRTHTAAVLEQARANDIWSEYQSKKIRADNTLVAIDLLQLQPSANATGVAAKIERVSQASRQVEGRAGTEEQNHAHELEASVSHAEGAGRVAMISAKPCSKSPLSLCSVTLFTRRRLYFYLGLSIGACGVLFASCALLVH